VCGVWCVVCVCVHACMISRVCVYLYLLFATELSLKKTLKTTYI